MKRPRKAYNSELIACAPRIILFSTFPISYTHSLTNRAFKATLTKTNTNPFTIINPIIPLFIQQDTIKEQMTNTLHSHTITHATRIVNYMEPIKVLPKASMSGQGLGKKIKSLKKTSRRPWWTPEQSWHRQRRCEAPNPAQPQLMLTPTTGKSMS